MKGDMENINQIWKKFDKDNSGVLEGKEADAFFDELCGKGTGLEDIKDLLKQLIDKDGDKNITKDEVFKFLNDKM